MDFNVLVRFILPADFLKFKKDDFPEAYRRLPSPDVNILFQAHSYSITRNCMLNMSEGGDIGHLYPRF